LPREIGEHVAGKKGDLGAGAFGLGKAACGIGRQLEKLGRDSTLRGCLRDAAAVAGPELV